MNITIEHLTKKYREREVLTDLCMEIPLGRPTVIMGPSGCGKTTLMRILLGLEKADSGCVKGIPDRVSAVFQEDRLCNGFSAYENIILALDQKAKGQKEKLELWKRICEDAAVIGITEENLHQKVETLSGGMRRRIALLRGIMYQGDCLILDEPFQGLDLTTKQNAIEYVKQKMDGKTVILVTHDQGEADSFDGNIIHFGSD